MAALPGCGTMGLAPRSKVVVVGGGYGGATAAKYLRMWSNGTIGVTVVEPNAEFVSCPLSNLVIGGSRQLADLTTSYERLTSRYGVNVVHDVAVDVGESEVAAAVNSGFTAVFAS